MTRDFSATTASVERYLNEIGTYPLLEREEERALALRARNGDQKAREALVQANLRLVVKIALEYVGIGLPLPDLISEGNIGLMRAAELYDPGRETKFSTYASLWIKQRMRRAITNQGKVIRVPIWKNQMLRRLKISSNQLLSELGRKPTEAELSLDSGMSPEEIKKLQDGSVQVMSLDAPLGGEDDNEVTMGTLLPDENAVDPAESLGKNELLMETIASLNLLNDKELEIIAMRFGLDGADEQTLDGIGQRFKLSRERIRQLQETAIAKLRNRFTDGKTKLSESGRNEAVRRVVSRLKALFHYPGKKIALLGSFEPLLSFIASQPVG